MIRKILSSCALIAALAAPALAQDPCVAPPAPTVPDGAKATPSQIVSAENDVKAFAAASDKYQTCLAREIGRQKDLAKQNNVEFDPNIQATLETQGGAQRKDAARVVAAWGATVQAFNAAQQRKQRQTDPRAQTSGGGGSMGSGYGAGGRY
ncbi:MAG TPA: hypothetical protein VNH44_03685 [Micropepsaceae bacterium]|nr:hypothetical protein [Micropepsaceae bacterium]